MPHRFEITLEHPAEQLITKLTDAAGQAGWSFDGDVNSGTFAGDGVKGEYACDGQVLKINLLEKPFIAPWSLVENKLREKLG